MKISIKQVGGYAGIEVPIAEVDTDTLAPDLAKKAKDLVQQIDFYSLPREPVTHIGADLLTYQITINDAGKQHTVSITDADSAENEKFRAFIQQISALQ